MPPITLTAIMYLTPGPINVIIFLVQMGPVPVPIPSPCMGNSMPATFVGYAPTVIMGGTPVATLGCMIPVTPIMPFAGPGAPIGGIASGTLCAMTTPIIGMPNVLVTGRPTLVCGLSMATANLTNSISDCPANPLPIIIG